jgi:hypothetical protein
MGECATVRPVPESRCHGNVRRGGCDASSRLLEAAAHVFCHRRSLNIRVVGINRENMFEATIMQPLLNH